MVTLRPFHNVIFLYFNVYFRPLSAEELERRRQQMMDFAKQREEERENNVKTYKKQDEQEKEREKTAKHIRHAGFIQ